MDYSECVTKLPSIASRLLAILAGAEPAARGAQTLVHFVNFATGSLYGLAQACALRYDPRLTDSTRGLLEHKDFLTAIAETRYDEVTVWAAAGGYYYNSTIVRLNALAEQRSLVRYTNKNELFKLPNCAIFKQIRTNRDALAHWQKGVRERRKVFYEHIIEAFESHYFTS